MAHKTETPAIIVLGVCVYNYVNLSKKSMLSWPENVIKGFTVWVEWLRWFYQLLASEAPRGAFLSSPWKAPVYQDLPASS